MMRVVSLPLLALVWIYRRFVSPVLPPSCRYYPSCSQYAEEAVRVHGPVLGPILALRRLLRCHPWALGGPDPVPPRAAARRVDGSNRGVEAAARREVAADELRQISETGHQV